MNHRLPTRVWPAAVGLSFLLVFLTLGGAVWAQVVFTVDEFDPSGVGSYNYADGEIGSVWGNWFGDAFESLVWDSNNDASNNPNSGSMKITADFNGQGSIPDQFEVYDFNGFSPPLNGNEYTNFQCDVRFDPSSATEEIDGALAYGYLEFGVQVGNNQDYFGGVVVPAVVTNTNWVHVSLPINAVADSNLASINDILIHIYGPYFSPGLDGTSILWVDNIKFVGPNPIPPVCVVDWNDVHQRIDGFGASSAWSGTWTSAQADMFFSTNTGAGLSLLRTRIVPGGTTTENAIMQMAQARGARVWSTPWSPDPLFKDNDDVNGGDFLPASNQAYANQLAGYVASIKNNYGVSLYAISVQNEPSIWADYESCIWTAQQIHDFVPYLHNALVASNVASTKILLAEDPAWETNLYGTALGDPSVATNVGIIACHDYAADNQVGDQSAPATMPGLDNPSAALWETEVSTFDDYDGSINNALYWASRIHLFMTVASANAFHYWWLISDNPDNEGLTDMSGNPAKRLYVLGNYSRFVRPGFYRIGVTNNGFTSVSAYKDTNSGNFAIVAINSGSTTAMQTVNLAGFSTSSVTPWITSGAMSLSNQPPVAVINASFAYPLPPLSVVTFVGQAYVAPFSIAISGVPLNRDAVVLTWKSVPGATYSVLKTDVLDGSGNPWPAIVTGYPTGGVAGGWISYTDAPVTLGPAFYRVSNP